MEYKREGSPVVWFIIKLLVFLVIAALTVDLILLIHNLVKYSSSLENFITIFLNIVFEGFPFIVIGSLFSALIEVFISEETIEKLLPGKQIFGVLSAVLAGFILPICECAIVPIAKRLIDKGMPVAVAVTFMLATPIVNPVVIASTYYAFSDKPYMIFARIGLGALAAITVGCLIGALQGNKKVVCKFYNNHGSRSHCSYHKHGHKHTAGGTFAEVISHTGNEFYNISRFFIFGAFLSALMQAFIPKNILFSVGKGSFSSIIVMMTAAFVLSICSDTDAFIARTFLYQFTSGSVLAFLILGPMLDIKNTIMLSGSFNAGFVTKLILSIAAVCFLMAVMFNAFATGLTGFW